ncbi:transcription termination factor MTEF18, mitochondrial [Ricinus communis]|uniref:transcription termination factor MTEF18, mitochondrial n=1 Tax=Ricinus communis TaxID=3988 RepID=UPI00201A9378|nr:transcription termination factor MTEF18, mitochondrial [Ricinus communis]
MVLPRICKRVLKLSQMTAQLNHFLAFSPVFFEKSNPTQNPCFLLLKVRFFSSARLTHNPKISHSESTESLISLSGNRVSRTVRAEAQDVLFEYLHSTRSFSFTDADHISKNSPHFLQQLLFKIDNDKDVARSLGKFLRYNPINEFEPFFESIGLCPSELSSLLPRHLFFLTDDYLLLENFHVLCDYGIPRVKIGKMYKEAREIFRYDFGLLVLKLQAYENLSLSKTTVIKLVSCCPSLLIGSIDNNFVNFLEKLNRLGIESDHVGGYMLYKDSCNWKRMLDTMDFLDKVGYSEEQLYNLFKTNPLLVLEGSGKRVYVLFGRLLKLGLDVNEVYMLFIENPQILSAKCEKNILQALEFLLYIRMRIEEIANIIYEHMELLCSCSLKRPNSVCKELNVTKDDLCQIIREDPMKFFNLVSKSKGKSSEQILSEDQSKKRDKVAFLLRLGYVENSDEMMRALKKFRGRGDQLQERYDCLVQAGLDCNVVSSLIRHAPMVLNQTKDVIEKKIDCLTRCLGYPLTSVVAFPTYLCYDIERINHRFRMYVWLKDRGAAKPMLSLSTILACSDARFEKYFVDIHPEGPAVWKSLQNMSLTS